MSTQPLSHSIKHRIREAAHTLGASDPVPYVGGLLDRSFERPEGDEAYAHNTLAPGTVAFEPSFSEQEPRSLRFTIEPLGPDALPATRRQEATREMRRLTGLFGRDALKWFDAHSEAWRGLFSSPRLQYGAWFGSAYDGDGLQASKVYYELTGGDLYALPRELQQLVTLAQQALPGLLPIFTTLACRRTSGKQRVTLVHRGPLRLADLGPFLQQLGLGGRLASVLQVAGVALGGRFDVPDQGLLLGLAGTVQRPEVKLEILLGMLGDLPPDFLRLVTLSLAERPRQLQALQRWLNAFTPAPYTWPGEFSVLSIRLTPGEPARVSLYLRPVEFDLHAMATTETAGDGVFA